MRRLVLLIIFCLMLISSNVFAKDVVSTQKSSENILNITINSDNKIKVTGYTIVKGSNIIIYYVSDQNASESDSIKINLNTVVRPYKILISNVDKFPSDVPFSDIATHRLKDYILHLYNLGYIDGYDEDGTFKPDNNITRAELITLLVKLFDLKENSANRKYFSDLYNNHWAYQYVLKAGDNNLIEGYLENGNQYIKLNNNITVAEASKIINSAFSILDNKSFNYDTRFTNHWSKQYIQNLLNENIINEKDDLYIDGNLDRPITRGEVSMLLSRALGR